MNSQPIPSFRPTLLVAALALGLGGCAITPTPLTDQELKTRVAADQAALSQAQEPVSAPLTLGDAVARALKYNMEQRVRQMEIALATNQADLAKYDLLPKLTANAGYTHRNNYSAASSMNVTTGTQSLASSTSEDKTLHTEDLSLTWNILDFGVSYWQARQQADRALIAEEHRRKSAQTLIQNVQQAYWLAAGAQQLEGRVDTLLQNIQSALETTRSAQRERLKPSMDVLIYQKSLLELARQLEPIRNELGQAKPRLAALMNLSPDKPFKLALPSDLNVPLLSENPDQLEAQALLNRPELKEADYQERISVAETKKAVLRILPGIEFSLGAHHSSNSFLVNQQWADGGVSLAWNLLNLLSAKQSIDTAEQQVELAKAQRLALSMAVLSQVQVAYLDFLGKQREFDMAREMEDVDSNILSATQSSADSGADNRMQLIRVQAAALVSELRKWQSYANLSLAWAQLKSSIGVDPMPNKVASYDLSVLAQAYEVRYTAPVSELIPAYPPAPAPAVPEAKPAAARIEDSPAAQAQAAPAVSRPLNAGKTSRSDKPRSTNSTEALLTLATHL